MGFRGKLDSAGAKRCQAPILCKNRDSSQNMWFGGEVPLPLPPNKVKFPTLGTGSNLYSAQIQRKALDVLLEHFFTLLSHFLRCMLFRILVWLCASFKNRTFGDICVARVLICCTMRSRYTSKKRRNYFSISLSCGFSRTFGTLNRPTYNGNAVRKLILAIRFALNVYGKCAGWGK